MTEYHDQEWGVPLHEDQALFELLILEGAQAGLSWTTILHRREGYRTAFHKFDPVAIAAFTTKDVDELVQSPLIIRNRAKIEATVANAQSMLRVVEEFGSFDEYLWSFVEGRPIDKARQKLGDIPAQTQESRAMSRDLKKRGFKFVGPTICYAFMQAAGLVNDHLVSCFRYQELS